MAKGNFREPEVEVVCFCGVTFRTTRKRITSGRGKACSRTCSYANRTRPSGLTYQKHVENPTSFKPGHATWNKGQTPSEDVGYRARHNWVKKIKAKPSGCEWCALETTDLHCANLSHEYKLELDDWAYLCRWCHFRYDRDSGAWGVATERFGKLDR